jgi:hypothetical protein
VTFWELWKQRDLVVKILKIIRQAIIGAKTVADARDALAKRLAVGAKAGDFDDAIKRLSDSDALVQDFVNHG